MEKNTVDKDYEEAKRLDKLERGSPIMLTFRGVNIGKLFLDETTEKDKLKESRQRVNFTSAKGQIRKFIYIGKDLTQTFGVNTHYDYLQDGKIL